MVEVPDPDEDGKDKGTADKGKKKFNSKNKDSGVRTNITKLIRMEGKTKKPIPAKTMDDIEKEITRGAVLTCIVYVNKYWANKSAIGKAPKACGIGLKMIAIKYIPGIGSGIDLDKVDFISEEETDGDNNDGAKEIPATIPGKGTKTVPAPPSGLKTSKSKDNKDNEEISKKPDKKSNKKADKSKSNSDDEGDDAQENSDDDNNKKKKKKSNKDDGDDGKQKKKKKSKKVDSDDDSDIDVKPSKKKQG